jgi:hypothetical protein
MMLLWHRAAPQFDPKRSQVNLRVVADKFSATLKSLIKSLENPKT